MPRSHPRYAPEFRAEAVRLVREGGRTPKQLATDLGCSEASISSWLKQADVDAGRRSDGLTSAERGELRQLRAENRVLQMERDLLKKRQWIQLVDATPCRSGEVLHGEVGPTGDVR